MNASRDRLPVLTTTTIERASPSALEPRLRRGEGRRTARVTAPPTVLVVFGTRPEAIKMLPVVAALEASDRFRPIVCSTGQHRDLLSPVLALFGRQADRDLAVMTPGQSLAGLTARVLTAVAETIAETRPDLVLVHGDTTTALAAAMAAFYARVPVGHVEAGLRSLDLARPWPEEFNRIGVDAVADLLFAPTAEAAENLRREAVRRGRIAVTGNPGIDALLAVAQRLETEPALRAAVARALPDLDPARRLVLVTAHRRESFGAGLAGICRGLVALAARGDVEIVWPLHPNPAVRQVVTATLAGTPGIRLVEPLGYAEMVALMQRATLIISDSGGIQEEAPALGRPVLVLRDVTERPEALATGVVRLVGTDPWRILAEAERLLDDERAYAEAARPVFPYGDGRAAERITAEIALWLEA
ncbi:MAG: UDP-N-acetylglucosamine 2-epimerase (non-hydrolyzing) [Elioraea sp.]|nr:UDP-N-acetylglucosamine 2-epimerase (non-hydrolyzing) [Elioraea sp.]